MHPSFDVFTSKKSCGSTSSMSSGAPQPAACLSCSTLPACCGVVLNVSIHHYLLTLPVWLLPPRGMNHTCLRQGCEQENGKANCRKIVVIVSWGRMKGLGGCGSVHPAWVVGCVVPSEAWRFEDRHRGKGMPSHMCWGSSGHVCLHGRVFHHYQIFKSMPALSFMTLQKKN